MGRMLLTLIGCCVIVFPITAQSEVDLTNVQATVNELNALLTTLIPPEWISTGGASDIDVISSILNGIIPFVAAGDYTAAESARLEAYAMLELGIEQRLRGFAPETAVEIESLFWQGTEGTPGLSVLPTDSVMESGVVSITVPLVAMRVASTMVFAPLPRTHASR